MTDSKSTSLIRGDRIFPNTLLEHRGNFGRSKQSRCEVCGRRSIESKVGDRWDMVRTSQQNNCLGLRCPLTQILAERWVEVFGPSQRKASKFLPQDWLGRVQVDCRFGVHGIPSDCVVNSDVLALTISSSIYIFPITTLQLAFHCSFSLWDR